MQEENEDQKQKLVDSQAENSSQQQESEQGPVQTQKPEDSQVQEQNIEADNNDQSNSEVPKNGKTGTVFQAQVNLFKGLVGLGILALPIGFAQAGWVLGVILIPVFGYVMYYCAILMIDIADNQKLDPKNICDFAYMMFKKQDVKGSGKVARLLTTIFLFCLQLGVCIGYTIFFMNYFQKSFCNYEWETGCEDRIYSVLFALVIVLPLGLIRRIENLKTPSNIANIILFIALGVMIYEAGTEINKNGTKLEKAVDFWGVSNYVGIVVFTFEGVGLFFDIRHTLPNPKEFRPALFGVVNFAIFIYILIGLVGYMAFGSKTEDLLIFNLPMDNWFYQSVQFLYSLILCLSFPLQLSPVAAVLENEIKQALFLPEILKKREETNPYQGSEINDQQQQQQVQENENPENPENAQNQEEAEKSIVIDEKIDLNDEQKDKLAYFSWGMRMLLTLAIFCFAMTLTKVSVFLNLAGSIGGIALLYVIPVFIFNLTQPGISTQKEVINWVISGIGIFAGACGIYTSIQEIYTDVENGFDLFFL